MSVVVENVLDLVRYFSEVAYSDVASAVLLAVGAILTGIAVALVGGLSLGAVLSPLGGGKY